MSETSWNSPLPPTGTDASGPYWKLEVTGNSRNIGLLIHKGEEKSAGGNVDVTLASEVWLVGNEQEVFLGPQDMSNIPAGSLSKSHAHWVKRNLILWRVAPFDMDATGQRHDRQFKLHYSRPAYMHITAQGVANAQVTVELKALPGQLPSDVVARVPHLYGSTLLEVPEEALQQIPELVSCQVAVSMHSASGDAMDSTGVQLEGLLDDCYYYEGPLGDHVTSTGGRALALWAPTAQKVELLKYAAARGGQAEVLRMAKDSYGVWRCERPAEWTGQCYKYRVTVFSPFSQRVEVSEATDPYSRATTANGERSIFVDLDDERWAPPAWRQHTAPPLASWTDITVYELHVRDFSANDATVPRELQGKYRAFCPSYVAPGGQLTAGLSHLKGLREAGMNHIHLLPSYDFGSAPERTEEQREVEEDLSGYPPDSERQQEVVWRVADSDAFQWGYDPVHWGVPEGSYSTQPDTPLRVLEYREMVAAMHDLGYRVVLDVVYNHTYRAGAQDPFSVLDKVVPGYYHRRQEDGDICHSACCNNTATEHRMCERLVIDDLVHWATTYKVDGFRFDIMGHMMVSTMLKIRSALDALTLSQHGVDGKSIYLYGEAWDFGEVAMNQRGRNASQINVAGTKIGAFNDRMRDGAMGGGPFTSPDFQGFVTGLALTPNSNTQQGTPAQQLKELLTLTDWVRLTLAGNLREYSTEMADGRVIKGVELRYHGALPVAYGTFPCENIPYVGCHDNETVFDQVTMKAPLELSAEARARMCLLSLSLVALSQGVPFFHAGDDLLRSKSLDRDSYNSGDWFNRIDWTGQSNNFGVGLPVAAKNRHQWALKRPLLAAADRIRPPPDLIRASARFVRALLRVRFSSPLFRMQSGKDIQRQLAFHNTGPSQVPGLIVMELTSSASPDNEGVYDPAHVRLLVLFNARPEPVTWPFPSSSSALTLHPALAALEFDSVVQRCAADATSRTVSMPERCAAVFVEQRGTA